MRIYICEMEEKIYVNDQFYAELWDNRFDGMDHEGIRKLIAAEVGTDLELEHELPVIEYKD